LILPFVGVDEILCTLGHVRYRLKRGHSGSPERAGVRRRRARCVGDVSVLAGFMSERATGTGFDRT